MGTVGILCTRMRIEEKALTAAFEAVGQTVVQLNPLDVPHLVGDQMTTDRVDWIVDRCMGRVAVSMLANTIARSSQRTFDAGLASTGTRIDVATALHDQGLPRPLTAFTATETAGLAALAALGFPSTFLPTAPGSATLPALDKDIGEAILEHRETLGHMGERIMVVQQGHASGDHLHRLIVIDGQVVATGKNEERPPTGEVVTLAIRAAAAIGASMCGVSILKTANGAVVWDIDPVPSFRDYQPVDERDPVSAIVTMVLGEHTLVTNQTRSSDVVFSV